MANKYGVSQTTPTKGARRHVRTHLSSYSDGVDTLFHDGEFTFQIAPVCRVLEPHRHVRVITFRPRTITLRRRFQSGAGASICLPPHPSSSAVPSLPPA